jgi:hypothetical protein
LHIEVFLDFIDVIDQVTGTEGILADHIPYGSDGSDITLDIFCDGFVAMS